MSAIFGNGIPQIKGTGTPDSTLRTLTHSVTLLDETNFSEKITKKCESVISYIRSWKHKGRHATFVIKVLLHQYTTSPTPKEWLTTLLTYEHQDVKFYLSSDATAPALKNAAGTEITLHVVNIEPDFEFEEGLSGDICYITLQTNEPFDLSKAILP